MSNIILCADDSKTMQTVAEITFRVSDYQYVGATSVDEALNKAREQKPALILADAIMPGKTGYELCKEIKADPQLAGVPVVMLCGNSAAYDPAKGSDAGADGHLAKPWDTQVMLDKVAEFIGKFGGASASAATSGTAAAKPAPGKPSLSVDKIKKPRLGATPSAIAAQAAAGKGREPARTNTIMGMPSIVPPMAKPAPPKPGRPARAPTPPPVRPVAKPQATPRAGTPPPVRPLTKPTIPKPIAPLAAKPGKPTAPPRLAVPPKPLAKPNVKPNVKPGAGAAARRPGTAPAKYAPPTMKSAITKPGVPKPPMPATKTDEGDGRPTTSVPAQLGPSGAAATPPPQPVRPPTPPPVSAKPTPAAKPTAQFPLGRPPLIRGVPTKRPAFIAPAALKVDVRRATQAAVARAAAETGLAADGPEVKALLALSQDVVERLIWEIVPDLAEAIIRENLDTLTAKRG